MTAALRLLTTATALLLLTAVVTAGADDPSAPRFEIHRVDFVPDDDAPILTDHHIENYCWATQRVALTAEGVRRWHAQGGFTVPLTGLPIQILVDGEPCYAAMIWNPVSSQSCPLPQFWCTALDGRLLIGSRTVTAAGDTLLGAAYDPRVKQVFTELGKLTEDCRGR